MESTTPETAIAVIEESKIPDISNLQIEANPLIEKSSALVVVTHEQYMDAGENLKKLKGLRAGIVDLFVKPKKYFSDNHKSTCALEKNALLPFDTAIQKCSQKIIAYDIERERLEKIEAERRQKEADELAKKQAAEALKKQDDERLQAAEQLQAQGFDEDAEAMLAFDLPAPVVAPVYVAPVQQAEKVKGVSVAKRYKARVVDMKLLIDAVSKGIGAQAFLEANMQVLNKQAQSLKMEFKCPGVVVEEERNTTTRLK